MFEVIENQLLAPRLHRMVVAAPRVAAARQAGQFVIVRSADGGERIPLTIGDADPHSGTITLFIQAIGRATRQIADIAAGAFIRDIAGPLGQPTHLENWGRVACVGGGVGTAVLFPLVRALAEKGNQVTSIIGGRSRDFIILEDELSRYSHRVTVTTEDGIYGRKGFVTLPLAELLEDPDHLPQAVFAVGPVPMMRAVCEQTRAAGIPTIVSLNPIMIDGTGMCGGCRVQIGEQTRFACVDGPEFDGHQVDFASLMDRLSMYKDHECRLAS
jgi:ferredoxin--NADP+ reductase